MAKFFTGFTVFHLIGIGLMVCGHWLPGGQPTRMGSENLFGSGFSFGFTISFVQVVGAGSYFYEVIKSKLKK